MQFQSLEHCAYGCDCKSFSLTLLCSDRHIEQTPVISDQKMSSDMNQVRKLDQLEERLQVAEGRAAVEKLRRSLNEIQLQLPKQNVSDQVTFI